MSSNKYIVYTTVATTTQLQTTNMVRYTTDMETQLHYMHGLPLLEKSFQFTGAYHFSKYVCMCSNAIILTWCICGWHVFHFDVGPGLGAGRNTSTCYTTAGNDSLENITLTSR